MKIIKVGSYILCEIDVESDTVGWYQDLEFSYSKPSLFSIKGKNYLIGEVVGIENDGVFLMEPSWSYEIRLNTGCVPTTIWISKSDIECRNTVIEPFEILVHSLGQRVFY